MSEVVSSTGERSEKDKGNVGRLALLVAPIRDRIQLKPRIYTPRTNDRWQQPSQTIEIERERERKRPGEWYSQDGSLTPLKPQNISRICATIDTRRFQVWWLYFASRYRKKSLAFCFTRSSSAMFDHVSLLTVPTVRFIVIIRGMICEKWCVPIYAVAISKSRETNFLEKYKRWNIC